MAINTEITRISGAKADIKTAIEAKGVSVPSDALIDTYDDYVAAIPGEVEVDYNYIRMLERNESSNYELSIPSSVTRIGDYVFSHFVPTPLIKFKLPSSVTSIGESAFEYTHLDSIIIPEGVTSIGKNCFQSCGDLRVITLPSTLTTFPQYTGAFYYCGVDSLNIPEGTTDLPVGAFTHVTGLTTLFLPSTLTTMGRNCIHQNSALKSITCKAITPPTNSTHEAVITSTNTALAHIYVPSASVNAYKAAPEWSDFASIIEPMPTTILEYNFQAQVAPLSYQTPIPSSDVARSVTIGGETLNVYDFTGTNAGIGSAPANSWALHPQRNGMYNGGAGIRKLVMENLTIGDKIVIRVSGGADVIMSVMNLTLVEANGDEVTYTINDSSVYIGVQRYNTIYDLKVVRPYQAPTT